MDIILRLFVLFVYFGFSYGDVGSVFKTDFAFHQNPVRQPSLLPPYGSPSTHSYQPPENRVPDFFHPQVSNLQANHRNVIPVRSYLPPPIQTDPSSSSAYLPPETDEHVSSVVVSDEPSQQGYIYNWHSSTTESVSSDMIPQLGDESFIPDVVGSTEKPLVGYSYSAPSYLPPKNISVDQERLHVPEMRCQDQPGGYLKAIVKIGSILEVTPVVDNDDNNAGCGLSLKGSYLFVNIYEDHFSTCGVSRCGKELCLRIRFPSIRGMRTEQDLLLTLHCKVQSRVAMQTHTLKVGVVNGASSRSGDVYARGGSQNQLRSQAELLRKTASGYVEPLKPNEIVQLGEELILKIRVRESDGWKYTKLTDINLQRIALSGDLLASANLITANGCVNKSMRSVCLQPPVFEEPLGHRLVFKAIMFQGMRNGDEMVLSVKISGCLEYADCQINTHHCEESYVARQKRESGTEFSEVSRVSYRVGMGESSGETGSHKAVNVNPSKNRNIMNLWFVGCAVGFVIVICLLGIVLNCIVNQHV